MRARQTLLARLAESFGRSSLWHREHSVWGQRMTSASFDRWLYLRLHRAGRIGGTERDSLQSIVRPGMTALDVGANLGLYTVLLSRLVGTSGRVIAFEPDPHHFALLLKNCALNACANVEAHNLALGSDKKRLLLHKEILNSGNNFLGAGSRHSRSELEVDVVSIDGFLPALRPDLVKIDVQGWEVEVLRGMRRMLTNAPHIALYLEFWPMGLRRAGSSPDELLDLLAGQGFQIYLSENRRHTPLGATDLAALTARLGRSRHANLYAAR